MAFQLHCHRGGAAPQDYVAVPGIEYLVAGHNEEDSHQLTDASVTPPQVTGIGRSLLSVISAQLASPQPESVLTEKRKEPRFKVSLTVQIWGKDAQSHEFCQDATAADISLRGALLTNIKQELRSGDLIGLRWQGRSARFRVVWTSIADVHGMRRVALHRLESEACPWLEALGRLTEDRLTEDRPTEDRLTDASR